MKKILIFAFLLCPLSTFASDEDMRTFALKVTTLREEPDAVFFHWYVWRALEDVRLEITVAPMMTDNLTGAPSLNFTNSSPAHVEREDYTFTIFYDGLSAGQILDFKIQWEGNAAMFSEVRAHLIFKGGEAREEWQLWRPVL